MTGTDCLNLQRVSAIRLWFVPAEAIPELQAAFVDHKWVFLISKWNEYAVTSEKLCYCPKGQEIVQRHLPALWSSPSLSSSSAAIPLNESN